MKQPCDGACVVDDQDTNSNQHHRGKDMGIAPERRSESGMTYHSMRKHAPQRCHGDEYHGDDGDLAAGVDGEGRHINADVVATIGYGHKRDAGNVSITAGCAVKACGLVRGNSLVAQRDKFPDANDDRKYSQQAEISFGDHQREQGPGCTHHK